MKTLTHACQLFWASGIKRFVQGSFCNGRALPPCPKPLRQPIKALFDIPSSYGLAVEWERFDFSATPCLFWVSLIHKSLPDSGVVHRISSTSTPNEAISCCYYGTAPYSGMRPHYALERRSGGQFFQCHPCSGYAQCSQFPRRGLLTP